MKHCEERFPGQLLGGSQSVTVLCRNWVADIAAWQRNRECTDGNRLTTVVIQRRAPGKRDVSVFNRTHKRWKLLLTCGGLSASVSPGHPGIQKTSPKDQAARGAAGFLGWSQVDAGSEGDRIVEFVRPVGMNKVGCKSFGAVVMCTCRVWAGCGAVCCLLKR